MTISTETPIVNAASESPELNTHTFNLTDTIQTVIASMDAEQSAVVNQTDDTWKFRYGTVEVVVNITGTAPTDTFTVLSTVLTYPVKDEAKMLRLLLEKNVTETFEARFAIQNDQVIVVSSRSVEDLSPAEISRIITIVAAIADSNDELLTEQFGT
ncbi:YbjN domain-containing protein [Tumidithrix helvetica PCC 7403]|uniref:YbjN domain-containing protein n=1 Tax=Tumidithrix helvetica TaxID=3457545 RepID=UPI003C82F9B0